MRKLQIIRMFPKINSQNRKANRPTKVHQRIHLKSRSPYFQLSSGIHTKSSPPVSKQIVARILKNRNKFAKVSSALIDCIEQLASRHRA